MPPQPLRLLRRSLVEPFVPLSPVGRIDLDYRAAATNYVPLGYWRLGEPSGTTAIDQMSASTGAASNCTVAQPGLISDTDTAYTFNGTTSNVDISYRAWVTGAGKRTTKAWVKTSSATTQAVLHYGTASSGQWWGMRVNSNGQMGLSLFGTDLAFGSAGALSDGVRHLIAATYDGTNVRAYIDGVEASGSPSAQSPNTVTGNAWIGTDGSNYFSGTIDEPAIYNYALTVSEIANLYAVGTRAVASGPITVTVPVATAVLTAFAPVIVSKIVVPLATLSITTYAPTATTATSLQAMINAASPGGTVNLGGLTYHEAVTVNKALTLLGPGTIDGDNTRTTWITATANDVVVDNVTCINAASGAVQSGSIDFNGVLRGIVKNSTITGGSYAAIRFWTGANTGMVDNCVISGSPVVGVLAFQSDDLTVQNSTLYDHNLLDVGDPGWEAGGVKVGDCTGVTYHNNTVYNIHGPGLWADISADNCTITNNRVYDCTRNGIHYEISDTCTIDSNVVWSCGTGFSTAWWGAGIISSSSTNVTITNNLVAWCEDGIAAINQDRDDGTHPQWNSVASMDISNNTIVMFDRGYALGWFKDFVGGNIFTVGTNFGNTNVYWYPGTPSFAWNGDLTTLASFNATDGETGGTLMSVATRDSTLIANSVPILLPIPTPPTTALTLTTFAPSVGNPQTVTVPVKALTLTTFAPVVGSTIIVPVKALVTTAFAPTVVLPQLVTVPVATLVITTYAPTLAATQTVIVPVRALTLTTFAPTVVLPQTVTVPVKALTLTSFAPVVGSQIVVPAAALILTPLAPSALVGGGSASVTVPAATLVIATFSPVVSVGLRYAGDALRRPRAPIDRWRRRNGLRRVD